MMAGKQKRFAGKEALLGATRRVEDVETEVGTVRVRQMTAAEAIRYGEMANGQKASEASIFFLERCLLDGDGEQMLTRGEARQVFETLPASVMTRLMEASGELNALSPGQAEQVGENFTGEPNDDSLIG